MKLPRKLRIAGFDWSVSGRKRGMEGNRGDCDLAAMKIRIDTTEPDQVQASSLLHELIHALLPEASEARTLELEQKLYALFNDNPGLARTIWGKNA